MRTRILSLCIGLLLLIPVITVTANSDARIVKEATDLKNIASDMQQNHVPLMVFFAAEDCEFCERLEADYLGAMAQNETYKQRVIIRKVMIDSYDEITDFTGEAVAAEDFSDRFNIQVTPTLVMMDKNGKRLTKKIVGYNRSGMFGAYLDEVIDDAHTIIHKSL